MTRIIPKPFGPNYPKLEKLGRFRQAARHGLKSISIVDRRIYGQAVLDAINAMNQNTLARETPTRPPHCASGTAHTTGKAILRAIREQNKIKWKPAFYTAENFENNNGDHGGLGLTHKQRAWFKAELERQERRNTLA